MSPTTARLSDDALCGTYLWTHRPVGVVIGCADSDVAGRLTASVLRAERKEKLMVFRCRCLNICCTPVSAATMNHITGHH